MKNFIPIHYLNGKWACSDPDFNEQFDKINQDFDESETKYQSYIRLLDAAGIFGWGLNRERTYPALMHNYDLCCLFYEKDQGIIVSENLFGSKIFDDSEKWVELNENLFIDPRKNDIFPKLKVSAIGNKVLFISENAGICLDVPFPCATFVGDYSDDWLDCSDPDWQTVESSIVLEGFEINNKK